MSKTTCKTVIAGLVLGLAFAFPALAGDISIYDPTAHIEEDDHHGKRIDIYMNIENTGGVADRLYAVRSKVAKTGQMAGGIDKRASGHGDHLLATVIDVPAKGSTRLVEDGHHVMLVDLKKEVHGGDTVQVTLFFEKAGRVKIEVPVMEEHD